MVYISSQKKIVTQCTTVHPRYDTRIFKKMCITLSCYYNVNLIVADGVGNSNENDINIIDLGISKNRFFRILKSLFLFPYKAITIKSDVYHLHDPELIPAGLFLKLFGKKIIYDIHESYSEDILTKYWITPIFRKFISKLYYFIETIATYTFDLNICATSYINTNVKWNSITINNYPIINDRLYESNNIYGKYFIYVGVISKERGIFEVIEASIRCNIKIIFCGTFENKQTKDLFNSYKNKNIIYLGQVDSEKANSLMYNAIAGFVLFYPGPNHDNSLPNKLFEYMSNNLPIICTNFKIWKSIVEKNECGICVDPFDENSIDEAILIMNNNIIQRQSFKFNCSNIIKNYSWSTESVKLINEYIKILN